MAKFNPDIDIPDLAGQVFLITGGTAGLGARTALRLAQHDAAKIYITGRNAPAAEALIASAGNTSPNSNPTITFLPCDFTSLASVHSAAQTFLARESRLDVLICNAGVMATPPSLTSDGYESQFGINHLGHAMLIRTLLPLLRSSSPSPRIVLLTSLGWQLHPRGGINFDQLTTPMECKLGGSWLRYGQSKLANVVYARELSKRVPGVEVVSVHPGVVRTGLVDGLGWVKYGFVWVTNLGRLVSADEGCWNTLWAATGPTGGRVNGGFYEPVGVLSRTVEGKEDWLDEVGGRLWQWTEGVLGGFALEEIP
ncbi:oxidoreductase [Aspergillus sclerotiicarbonarius CBS 121057]|uniref:Oxidoreductase n=1 Tax=Aspergillus sclerotiicarbonarius (strain CBS 121057 / IBT 28362) TaxID=1448318 RepID=A0A319EJN3_ASPSB|nr:oxidoreductase [Aspergillus sclerotiicarbonarius CBS 121057]